MTFDQFVAAYAIGELLSSDLPGAATQALVEGYDSVDLAALAGSTTAERSPAELEELWKRGLRQLGKPIPKRADAGRCLRDYYVSLVTSGSLTPRAGAAAIVRLTYVLQDELPSREYAGDGLGVARLLGLYYSHDDVPFGNERAHREIDEEIKAECERLEGARSA